MAIRQKELLAVVTEAEGRPCPLDGGAAEVQTNDQRPHVPRSVEEPVVTAADLVRGFSECRDLASKTPVYVTHHGRPTHVLMGVDAFRGIMAQSAGMSQKGANERLYALADWVDQAVIICDQDMRVAFVNRVASAICRKAGSEMRDHLLVNAMPEIAGSLMEVHVRRTVIGGEPSAADIPSPFADGAWLRLQSFPLGSSNVVMFRDITEDVQRHRMADVKSAIINAIAGHGEIGYVRLSVRGVVESAETSFASMLFLPQDRIVGVLLTDMIVSSERHEFRQALERAMQGGTQQCLHTSLLNNRGETVPIKASIVPLHGAYGTEGAVVLMTVVEASPRSVVAPFPGRERRA